MRKVATLLFGVLIAALVGIVGAGILGYLANECHLKWAEVVARPFGLLGFVLGNPHQGDDRIAAICFAAVVTFAAWWPVTLLLRRFFDRRRASTG